LRLIYGLLRLMLIGERRVKCNYCDFVWEDEEEYGKHLNATHTKCFHCSTVFNNDEFDDDYVICGKCREKENEE
jgi:DNA-directed RNA polymerase subunit RPC12/RpoP